MKRRKFIYQAAAATAGGMAIPGLVHSFNINRSFQPNNKINIGVVGCNGMGWSNVKSFIKNAEVDLRAICDVDQNVIEKRFVEYTGIRKNKPRKYTDYRELLENKSLDAVIIGTPDHWHCKMMVDAVEAGKHVYVEKPAANSIEECYIMMKAADKSGKMVQTGQWQRSGTHYREAIDIVQSGKLGNIRLVKVWAYQGWMKPVPVVPDSVVPEGVDYEFWLGPATMRPFNANRFHFNFRWFWDYAGGLMTDWGVHEIDIALLTMKTNAPKSIMASGGKLAYPDDASETPDTLQAIFEYDDFNMLWEHATGIDLGPYNRREGIAYIGNNGTLVLNREGYEVLVEKEAQGYASTGTGKMESIEGKKRPEGVSYLDLHTANFLEAMKANDSKLLNSGIHSGSIAAINAHMGNVAYRTGKKVYWDNEKQTFNDSEADAYIHPTYHNGWKIPEY